MSCAQTNKKINYLTVLNDTKEVLFLCGNTHKHYNYRLFTHTQLVMLFTQCAINNKESPHVDVHHDIKPALSDTVSRLIIQQQTHKHLQGL